MGWAASFRAAGCRVASNCTVKNQGLNFSVYCAKSQINITLIAVYSKNGALCFFPLNSLTLIRRKHEINARQDLTAIGEGTGNPYLKEVFLIRICDFLPLSDSPSS